MIKQNVEEGVQIRHELELYELVQNEHSVKTGLPLNHNIIGDFYRVKESQDST